MDTHTYSPFLKAKGRIFINCSEYYAQNWVWLKSKLRFTDKANLYKIRLAFVWLVFFIDIHSFCRKEFKKNNQKHTHTHQTVELIFPFIYTVKRFHIFGFDYNMPFIGIKQSVTCLLSSLPKCKNSANFLSKNRTHFPLVEYTRKKRIHFLYLLLAFFVMFRNLCVCMCVGLIYDFTVGTKSEMQRNERKNQSSQ